jgi:hypothetical protein
MSNPVDITHKPSQMPPESGILYRNRVSSGNDSSTYIGVIRVREPGYYWVELWQRTVWGKLVIELRFSPKT